MCDDVKQYNREQEKAQCAPFEFKVGDICSFGGARGEVVSVSDSTDRYPVRVEFPCPDGSSGVEVFTLCGRLYTSHTEPLLKLVSRPKKKVEKCVDVWVAFDTELRIVHAYKGCPYFDNKRYVQQKVTIRYEVEE